MKILVTGGAGFIGSHTCDRLLALGHDVIVLDALTPPVHRAGRPAYLSPGADFYQGDIRNRDLLTNLLRRVDAVYHFAAYQDYLPDFSRFSDVNVVSTALLYEIIVAERLDLARVVVASSQVGNGRRALPVPGRRRAATRDAPRDRSRRGSVGHSVPGVRRPAGDAGHAGADLEPSERVRHVEARPGDGRGQPRPPVWHPRPSLCATASSRVRGSRSTTRTQVRAGSSA